MAIIGTAGHVDHGKSTLVAALTGRDPDRWKEEKERGLTIDLGFAWMTVDSGAELSFVDVPGHERFIKNMLAGIETIDGALFVVAADEGWMPQSEEHLAVLNLLDTHHAVVVLTKTDLVDDDLLELATLEVGDHLAGTGLSEAPVIPVSAKTGAGLDVLRGALDDMVAAVEAGRFGQRPRLWVDRSFSVSGAGTVVTGSLMGGSLAVGDEVEIWPGGMTGRIRTLHRHESEHERVPPGSRCAVNLGGVDRTAIGRGSLLGEPGSLLATDSWLAQLTTARYVDGPLTARGAYHLHLGAGAWPVGLRPLDSEGLHGVGLALLRPEVPIPVRVGDRFISREVGRRAVVAGGRILDPDASPRRTHALSVAARLAPVVSLEPDAAATLLLDVKGIADPDALLVWTGGRPDAGITTPELVIAADLVSDLTSQAVELVQAFHDSNPLREGYPKASLASQLGVDLSVLSALVSGTAELNDNGATIAAPSFHAGLSEAHEAAWSDIRERLVASGASVPRIKELALEPELLHVLLREGRLIRISEDFAYLPEQLENIVASVGDLPDEFTVAEFRDTLGLSRKYAVPLLEYLDGSGVTRRSGDTRSLRR